MTLVRFMSSAAGRVLRIVLGLVLVAVGYLLGGTAGIVLAIVGLVPIAAGVANVCLIAPVFGAPFSGRRTLQG